MHLQPTFKLPMIPSLSRTGFALSIISGVPLLLAAAPGLRPLQILTFASPVAFGLCLAGLFVGERFHNRAGMVISFVVMLYLPTISLGFCL
jgi:hypothetical protein